MLHLAERHRRPAGAHQLPRFTLWTTGSCGLESASRGRVISRYCSHLPEAERGAPRQRLIRAHWRGTQRSRLPTARRPRRSLGPVAPEEGEIEPGSGRDAAQIADPNHEVDETLLICWTSRVPGQGALRMRWTWPRLPPLPSDEFWRPVYGRWPAFIECESLSTSGPRPRGRQPELRAVAPRPARNARRPIEPDVTLGMSRHYSRQSQPAGSQPREPPREASASGARAPLEPAAIIPPRQCPAGRRTHR